MKRAIFFDLDGTLIDSAPDLADALNFTLDSLGLPTYSLDTIRNWIGGGASMLVKRGLSGSKEIIDLDENFFHKALDIFMEYYSQNLTNKTSLYPHAKEVLDSLRKNYKLALITNKPSVFVEPILNHFGLDHFSLVLGGDSLPQKKPSAMPLLHALERFDIKSNEALMVGDSASDYFAAKEANVPVVLVSYGYDQDIDKFDTPKITSLQILMEFL
ncbi:phosphoglycolate phosphatase [Nitratiruptor sp. YY09-18]|uniref:phosphoglycolate phosphatase n=1 Tax=Nitratiruptor sp. YY09-18 TaxID=2724901 RepID=UPI0019166D33|nr:phosphoglycolate phosphatase [Nitratiruptor sp. YY09-18]BCD67328.1 phosphoglycolate phosphatase [Nitratiruptor sp. YY09-18]